MDGSSPSTARVELQYDDPLVDNYYVTSRIPLHVRSEVGGFKLS
jgi:hypothetical protein